MTRRGAALLHGLRWDVPDARFELGEGAALARAEGSPAGALYRQLCLYQGIDDGEPLGYEVYLECDDDGQAYSWNASYSTLSQLLNLLVVVLGNPITVCRMIWSVDGFASSSDTTVWFDYRPTAELLISDWRSLTPPYKSLAVPDWLPVDLQTCRALRQARENGRRRRGRVASAFEFFDHAWRSYEMEHMCLNLAIVLETLCAPHSQGETTHQIAFNVAHLLGGNAEKKRETYQLVREFYSFRSAITHGGRPDIQKLEPSTMRAFDLAATILKRLALKPDLAEVFSSEDSRKKQLLEYMFPDE